MPSSFSIRLPIDLNSAPCMERLFGMDQMDSCTQCTAGLFCFAMYLVERLVHLYGGILNWWHGANLAIQLTRPLAGMDISI